MTKWRSSSGSSSATLVIGLCEFVQAMSFGVEFAEKTHLKFEDDVFLGREVM